jgi:hypothetical protein
MADHPVKVPAELVKEWMAELYGTPTFIGEVTTGLADRAAQWAWDQREPELQERADQELEACCEYLQSEIGPLEAAHFRAARRPKPPTLAEQGIEALSAVVDVLRLGFPDASINGVHIQTLTAALNRLAELEAQQ